MWICFQAPSSLLGVHLKQPLEMHPLPSKALKPVAQLRTSFLPTTKSFLEEELS